jgi:hypothetical protein
MVYIITPFFKIVKNTSKLAQKRINAINSY